MILCAAIIQLVMAVEIGPMAAGVPAREPQFAVDGNTVALVFGSKQSIYFTSSSDGGKTFSEPILVAGSPIVPLTRHRGPRIVFSSGSIVVTAVVGTTASEGEHSHGLPSDGDLKAWSSTDRGRTWSKGVSVNDAAGASSEGLHTLAADSKGNLFAAWLDKRSGATELYGANSSDGGRTWSKNQLIYHSPEGTICQCCHPSAAFALDGELLVMWRNWLGGSRDMYLARSKGGQAFSKPEKLGEGTWKLNACPMDGGAIALTKDGPVTAWRRERTLYLARPGQAEIPIGEGTDVSIAASKDGIYAIWTGKAGMEILTPGSHESRVIGERGGFPAIAALPGGGAIAAWETKDKLAIERVR